VIETAERRMFAKTIVLSDAFLDMPLGARCLYMTLGMVADDDGFVNNPRSIMRQTGATDDDMKILIAKKFVLLFEDGVLVIKHWRLNNYLQKDRYKPTVYQDDYNRLVVDDKNIYHMPQGETTDQCIHSMCIHSTVQDSTVQDSIGQVSTGTVQGEPSLEEVRQYAAELKSKTDPERFYNYYAGKWATIRDWRALFRSWSQSDEKRPAAQPAQQQRKGSYFVPHGRAMSYAEYEAMARPAEDDDDDDAAFEAMLKGGTT